MSKVLLHCCCAVCASYPYELLHSLGYDIVFYFYNPNIYPNEEYQRRLEELKKFSKLKDVELIIENDCYENWLNNVKGYENEPEKGKRCEICFQKRLEKTAQKGVEKGCDYFTTTLSVSPHKNSKQIFEVAKKLEKENLKFLEIDFKKQDGFKKTSDLANEYGFYRQQYCGCEFSVRKL